MHINISDLGECILKYNNRSKTVKAKLVDDILIFTLPPFISYEEAIKAINQDKTKLIKFKEKVLSKVKPVFVFKEGEIVTFPHFVVHIESNNINHNILSYKDSENRLILSYSKKCPITSLETQDSIKKNIENICRRKAKTYIADRISFLANKHNFHYKEIKINKSRGKWGSCSSLGNINISLYCMMLPIHLLDLVLLHELCHTVEMNHSKAFWDLLDKVTEGQSKALTKELKNIKLLW